MFLCVIIRECDHYVKLYIKYVECCKIHFFMSTVKQFELSGAFLSRSLMALSLDISLARFFYSISICFILVFYGKKSKHMLRTNITTIAKAVQYHSLEKVIKQVEFIKTIELNCWHFFLFFCLCNRNGNALNEIGINDDNICQSCFLCPMGNSEEKWKAIKKLNFLKVKAKWTDSTSERKVPLSLHFPPGAFLGSCGLCDFVSWG